MSLGSFPDVVDHRIIVPEVVVPRIVVSEVVVSGVVVLEVLFIGVVRTVTPGTTTSRAPGTTTQTRVMYSDLSYVYTLFD